MKKLTIIGGSGVATPHLVRSLGDTVGDEVSVTLVGRSQQKLAAVARAAADMSPEIDVRHTTSLEEGVEGAFAVLNQIRVGGLEGRGWDEKAPTKLGLIGEESVGAGGFALGYRTLPVVRNIINVVETHAPDAWFVNLTNPAGLVLSTIAAESNLSAVSVCDIPVTMSELLSSDTMPADVRIFGTNHASAAVSAIDPDGKEILEELVAGLPDGATPFSRSQLAGLGFLPNPYLRYYYLRNRHEPKAPVARSRADELLEVQEQLVDAYGSAKERVSKQLLSQRNAHWYDEIVVPFLAALIEPEAPHRFVLQVPNRGLVPFLSDSAAVETDVMVEGGTVVPLKPPDVPEDLRALTVVLTESDELLRRGSECGDESLSIRALAMNPLVNDLDKATQFWEMFKSKWLQFQEGS